MFSNLTDEQRHIVGQALEILMNQIGYEPGPLPEPKSDFAKIYVQEALEVAQNLITKDRGEELVAWLDQHKVKRVRDLRGDLLDQFLKEFNEK